MRTFFFAVIFLVFVASANAKEPETIENTKDIVGYYHKELCKSALEEKRIRNYSVCIGNKKIRKGVATQLNLIVMPCYRDSTAADQCIESKMKIFILETLMTLS